MNKRPVITIPKTRTEAWHDLLSIAVLLGTVIYVLVIWADLPGRIPVHFNGSGQADGWGGKGYLVPLPIINTAVYFGFTFLRRFPHTFNYMHEITIKNAPRQYANAIMLLSWLKLQTVILFGYMEWIVAQAAYGEGDEPGLWFMFVWVPFMIATIIYYTIRSNRMR